MMSSPIPQEIVRCRGMTKSFGTGEAAVAALRGIDLYVCDGGECEVMGRAR